ncbi:MAG TPA: Nif3-like dinuclear metal center hexameric protein [Castellaniella sp.]|nr:Nif3-like dinuclear metal center hexameric protein [Castellaniella sp.]
MTQIPLHELVHALDDTLQPRRFHDYCPNGLQVEGRHSIGHIVAGVTASQALIEAAIEREAHAILVHHGWFWKNEDPCVRGPKRTRLARMLQHDLNLLAYHLPLDAHPRLGNNAQLARVLGWQPDLDATGAPRQCGPDDLVWLGSLPAPSSLHDLGQDVGRRLGRAPMLIGDPERPIRRVAWCTGAAQGFLDAAVDAGVDAYLSGEISEPTVHLAREAGVAYIAAGHHATERYGVQAVGAALAAQFGIRCDFIDIDNPV